MRTYLLIFLVIIALAMIGIGIVMKLLPPALTGVGFLVIAYLLHNSPKHHP
ncbi:hypothetical protein [Thermonema rossianum]|uniref:hypothetical protein n=1 Tax=Thermonema rossianum TaxID=55505 RepID=UPI00146FC0BE|nr:hypothetical protein [Thermonema rossianum]